MEECKNCHRKIGDLETPHLFNEQVVCAECYARLTAGPELRPAPSVEFPASTAPRVDSGRASAPASVDIPLFGDDGLASMAITVGVSMLAGAIISFFVSVHWANKAVTVAAGEDQDSIHSPARYRAWASDARYAALGMLVLGVGTISLGLRRRTRENERT